MVLRREADPQIWHEQAKAQRQAADETRWGDSQTISVRVPATAPALFFAPPIQLALVRHPPRVWSIRIAIQFVNAQLPQHDGESYGAKFLVETGLGSSRVNEIYSLFFASHEAVPPNGVVGISIVGTDFPVAASKSLLIPNVPASEVVVSAIAWVNTVSSVGDPADRNFMMRVSAAVAPVTR
jgi:hypothetical protein